MDFSYLFSRIAYREPVIAVYDSDAPLAYSPLLHPPFGRHSCCFAYLNAWRQGKTLALNADNFGCAGAGTWCLGQPRPDREKFIHFLADEEGLKDSHQAMGAWVDAQTPYTPRHDHILIGPFRPDLLAEAVTLSFLVDPDQLSLLITGANYHAQPGDPDPVSAPFGSGCGQILAYPARFDHPAAVIGATDIAMRQFLPPDKLLFSVNLPMARRLAQLDERSFLNRPFLDRLWKARKG